jgi:pyruvate kinase
MSDEILMGLIDAGVEVARLNFSHGTREAHADLYERLRRAADRRGRPIAVLQDLSGPKIRTGRLVDGAPVSLRSGQELSIAVGDQMGTPTRIFTAYGPLPRMVQPGQVLLLDDGRIELKVERTDGHEIVTTVVDGGVLGERKGINAPGLALPVEPLTPKDVEDLRFGLQLGVDFVAVSFVRQANDLGQAREIMTQAGRCDVSLVAKVERPEALTNLQEILGACRDGGARRSWSRDAARGGATCAEGDHHGRPGAWCASHCCHPGTRVHAHGIEAHPSGSK